MSNPSAAEVAAVYEAFEDARTTSTTTQYTTNKKQEALQELVALGIELARDIYDTVEFFYRKDPDASSRHAKCRAWGVAYVYGPGELAPVPDQADITNIATPGPGQVHFHYSALNALTYDVLHKGPTQTEFSKVADDVEATVYQGSGLAVGAHEFKVVGRNKAGEGKASEVAVVQVN